MRKVLLCLFLAAPLPALAGHLARLPEHRHTPESGAENGCRLGAPEVQRIKEHRQMGI